MRDTSIRRAAWRAADRREYRNGDTWRQEANDSLSQLEPHTHVEVVWNVGTTEGGSSGSFLATGKRFPKQFIVGVLTRGAASCSNRKGPDFYGSFQVTHDDNRKFRKHFD